MSQVHDEKRSVSFSSPQISLFCMKQSYTRQPHGDHVIHFTNHPLQL